MMGRKKGREKKNWRKGREGNYEWREIRMKGVRENEGRREEGREGRNEQKKTGDGHTQP